MSSGATRSPLSFPAYRRLFIARSISSAGSYMQIVAATWYAYSITGSATSIGLLSALALGPAIVGGPIGGALADRFDPRRLAVTLYVAQALPAIVMAALDLTGDLPLGWLYALTFAGAIPYSLNTPVISLVGPLTVPEAYRSAALAQASMMYNATRFAGAVAGGFLVHWVGIGSAFALNALSYLLLALVLARITLVSEAERRPEVAAPADPHGGALRLARLAALGVGVFFVFVAPIEQLMPTVADEHGMTAAAVGLLIGAIGIGAMAANPIIGKDRSAARRRRLMAIGLLLAAPGMVSLAITPRHGLPVDLLAAAVIGFGWEFVFVGGQTAVAVEAPAAARGRMMGLFFVLVTATTALGAVGLGLLINMWGMQTTFLLTAAVVTAAGVALLGVRREQFAQ